MKKKSFLVGALLAQSMFTFADVNFTLSDLEIAAGETKTVTVALDITDATKLNTYSMMIELPAGLHFKNFDKMTTVTDYGWTLVRSSQGTYIKGKEQLMNKVKFTAFTLDTDGGYLNKDSKVGEKPLDVAFTFDVVADDDYDSKAVAPIEMTDVSATYGKNPGPDYKIDGPVEGDQAGIVNGGKATTEGKVTRLYKLDADENYIMVNGKTAPDAIELTPQHEQTITVHLYNWASIRGLQGIIRIPKFLTFSDKGTIVQPRTTNETLVLGTPVLKGDFYERTFTIISSEPQFRDMNEYGTPIFQFKVKGNKVDDANAYQDKEGKITFDHFKATLKGSYNSITMDDEITLKVNNPNEVAMDEVWAPEVDKREKALEAQIKKIETDYSNVLNYIGITNQEANAQQAIDDLKAAIWALYEAGDLKDDSDFQALLDEADKQIGEILDQEIKKAVEAAEANNKLADDALQGINPEAPVPPKAIAGDDSEGTIGKAKQVYEDALKALEDAKAQAATDGTQADENVYEAELKAVAEAVDGIAKAIEIVQAKADANNKALEDAINLASPEGYALPDNVKEDDGKIGETGTWTAAKEALLKAQEEAAEAGTQAQDGVYDLAIQALKEAQETVITKAEDNNQKVADALVDVANYLTADPDGLLNKDEYKEIRENEDVKDAMEALENAVKDAFVAVADAAEAGTQAKDDIYKAELDAIAEAKQALIDEVAAKHIIAAANEKEVTDKLAETYDPGKRFDDIDETQEVVDAMVAWEEAKKALEDALQNSKDNGLLADDQYLDEDGVTKLELDDLIQAVTDALQTLQDAIDAATAIADEIDGIIGDGMAEEATELTEGEITKAKVANPEEVTQPEGKLPTTQAQYQELIEDLTDLIYGDGALQDQVEAKKADYLAGKISIDELRDYIDKTLPTAEEDVKKDAVERIVEYLMTVQRGDVGGDGRWTTNDYARLRKVILSEEYPTSPAINEKGELDVEKLEFDKSGNPDSEALYEFYRMDINQDGDINVGDAQAALNYTFYGSMLGPVAEARAEAGAEVMNATMNGNVIAVSLTNSRQYSALQMDVVLAEGMTVTAAKVAGRTADYSIATNELPNGATRILLTANEAGQAFEGNQGEVLFIEVAGMGQVDFQNIILADLNASTAKFNLNGVVGGATGIAGTAAANGDEQVFSLSGRVMNALKKGVNIIRRADGSTQKVIKK